MLTFSLCITALKVSLAVALFIVKQMHFKINYRLRKSLPWSPGVCGMSEGSGRSQET